MTTAVAVGILVYGHYRVLKELKDSFGTDADEFGEGENLAHVFPGMDRGGGGGGGGGRGVEGGGSTKETGRGSDVGATATTTATQASSPTSTPPTTTDQKKDHQEKKPPPCRDDDDSCTGWASGGECAKNPGFMLGACKESCGVCTSERLPSTSPEAVGHVTLNTGAKMPAIGYGTAGLGEHTKTAVTWALQAGYRLLDSGQAREWYREDLVGAGIAECGVVGLTREDLFLTSKLHPRHLGRETTLRQFESSLRDLRTDYVDLFLLHYPACWGQLCGGKPPEGTWRDSWRALEELHASGKARAIGVSNFDVAQLAELSRWAKVQPAVVQRNSDVFSADAPARHFSRARGWQYQAYSTLGSQWLMRRRGENPVLNAPAVTAAAAAHGASPAAVALRWALQKGQVVIPRSAKKRRIAENLNVTWFTLAPDEMDALDALDGRPP